MTRTLFLECNPVTAVSDPMNNAAPAISDLNNIGLDLRTVANWVYGSGTGRVTLFATFNTVLSTLTEAAWKDVSTLKAKDDFQ